MTTPPIPAAMREAVLRELLETDQLYRTTGAYDGLPEWDDLTEAEQREHYLSHVDAVLAHALSVCTVEERWRAQAGTKPGAVAWSAYAPNRAELEEWAQVHGDIGPVTYQRRLAILTPAEQVDTEEAPK